MARTGPGKLSGQLGDENGFEEGTLVHALPAGGIVGADEVWRIVVVGKARGIGEGDVQLARGWGGTSAWYSGGEAAKEGLGGVVGAGARCLPRFCCGAAEPVAEGLYERLGANGADAPFNVFELESSPNFGGRRIREVSTAVGDEQCGVERGVLGRGGPRAGQLLQPTRDLAVGRLHLGGRAAFLLFDRGFELAVHRPANGRLDARRLLGVRGFLVAVAAKARAQDQGEDEDGSQHDYDLREEAAGQRARRWLGELLPVSHYQFSGGVKRQVRRSSPSWNQPPPIKRRTM